MTTEQEKDRTSWKGWQRIEITSDATGRIGVSCAGNLTVAEVVLGLELMKKTLLDRGANLGLLKPPSRIDMPLEPKRF